MALISVGIDFSLRRATACALPIDFAGDLSHARVFAIEGDRYDLTTQATEAARAQRTIDIADQFVGFLLDLPGGLENVRVFFEDYAYGQVDTRKLYVAEACGVFRARLVQLGVPFDSINISTARKLLAGKVPSNHKKSIAARKAAGGPGKVDAKKLIRSILVAAGAPPEWPRKGEKMDEYDACCVANAGVHKLGGLALAQVL